MPDENVSLCQMVTPAKSSRSGNNTAVFGAREDYALLRPPEDHLPL